MSHLVTSIDAFSQQGFKAVNVPNHYNEDRVVIGTQVFAVIDGATSFTKADMNGLNTSAYTAKYLADFFVANDLADKRTAKDLLLEANQCFREHLEQHWPDIMALGKMGPCAAVAVIKFRPDGTISYANIADCTIVALQNNVWQLLSRHCARHIELDNQLSDAIFEEIDSGTPLSEAQQKPHVLDLRNKNRCLLNIEYGVFNGEPEMANFLSSGHVKANNITALALFSDGLFWPESTNEEAACISAAEKMYSVGVFKYYQELRNLKDNDPDFKLFRRLKHMDDATGLVMRFS
jgi:hypothetical protein